ncbi:hypothetical protein Pan258_25340 [Symmachiella dynata]|uniref:DUF4132 domain-containing protein n=1 Tax=Symmachiella dynata TaxID=2527995 RepID=UPI00118A1762|nr:DUF4132 domain-containing protein [Symmachiella dynata]QDT48492.1 hypothetical protein Pan258_25340 [Symmachiella dynata]
MKLRLPTFDDVFYSMDISKDHPSYDMYELVKDFARQNVRSQPHYLHDIKLKDSRAGQKIAALDKQDAVRLVRALIEFWHAATKAYITINKLPAEAYNDPDYVFRSQRGDASCIVETVFSAVMRRKLPLEGSDIDLLLNLFAAYDDRPYKAGYFRVGIVSALEHFTKSGVFTDVQTAQVKKIAAAWSKNNMATDWRRSGARLEKLISSDSAIPLKTGEAWSDLALEHLSVLDKSRLAIWADLLNHCQTATAGKPSKKWLKTAQDLVDRADREQFRRAILSWFPAVKEPRTEPINEWSQWSPDPNLEIIPPHADILKGLVWCASTYEDAEVVRALTDLAISSYKKIPQVGPRLVKVGNACVFALGAMPGLDAVGQLAILKVRVKFGTAQKGIEKALVAAAEREGIPREELEEMAVPAYGLTDVGVLREELGEFTAEVTVAGSKTELRWIKPDGKSQKSVPAAVKRDFGDELKELKLAAKDIEKMIPVQAARIEQVYLQQRSWEFPKWRAQYLDHPLVGTLARRLIWSFETHGEKVSAIYRDGRFVHSDNTPLENLTDGTTVTLWHPLDESTDDIIAWREWLLEHEVQQPFKQAHREVYLLTDAERNTGVYSNRFAGHILKQHQFNALCAARGWKNSLRLMVDATYPPAHMVLPNWNLRAEFWVEGAGEEYGVDSNETGTYLYLTTDQVRFYRDEAALNWAQAGAGDYTSAGPDEEENHPLALEEIPPLAFSELLRDVDLFVGVASAGNDPNWSDGGPEGRYRDYWTSYSFGDLGNTAQTRKTILERLVPRLKIAERCTFSDRFLIVQGDKRTYKIHLGSGNILMEPNDAYLCIVPGQSVHKGANKVFLPFEGDRTLSIILSKAFLLAEDTKIKDATILSQINH